MSAPQTNGTPPQDLRPFLTGAITSGTAQRAKVSFQPLPPPVAAWSQAQIAKIEG